MDRRNFFSSIEIADWFHKKAERQGLPLSDEKIQHLLFLAQIHHMLKEGRLLIPSFFICGKSGFYEAGLQSILRFGLPLMPMASFDDNTAAFLELIWKKYSPLSDYELNEFITSLNCWQKNYNSLKETVVDVSKLVDSFAQSIQGSPEDFSFVKSPAHTKKIMLSQNGPVQVSSWHPRKLKK